MMIERNILVVAIVFLVIALGMSAYCTVETVQTARTAHNEMQENRVRIEALQAAFDAYKAAQPHARYIEAEVRAFDRERAKGGSKQAAVEKASEAKREARP